MDKEKLTAYKLIREEDLTDIHSKGYILSHRKTGARVMLIENDDENKVFSIAFRTTPKDSTGVSVKGSICGTCKRFPEYIFKCNDISGQNLLSGSQL